ncbi:unnamed protein product, partial [Pylaiella littoralis]
LNHRRPFPTADNQLPAGAARGGKRRRTVNLKTNETQYCNRTTLDLDPRTAPLVGRHGSGEVVDVDNGFMKRYSERSKAAAKAAGAGGGGADGGGWCLLQKFIGPAGSKSSTLRCHWTASPSS